MTKFNIEKVKSELNLIREFSADLLILNQYKSVARELKTAELRNTYHLRALKLSNEIMNQVPLKVANNKIKQNSITIN